MIEFKILKEMIIIKKRRTLTVTVSVLAVLFLLLCVIFPRITAFNVAFGEEAEQETVSFSAFFQSIGAKELSKETAYRLGKSVSVFDGNRDSAQGYIYRFDVSMDGETVALVYKGDGEFSVAVYSCTRQGIAFEYGFDIALSEESEIRLTEEGLAVWLKESNVVFVLGRDGAVIDAKQLVFDNITENDAVKPRGLEEIERFFCCGDIERVTSQGDTFFLECSEENEGEEELYSALIKRSADGMEMSVYQALNISAFARTVTAFVGVVTVLAALCAVGLLIYKRV